MKVGDLPLNPSVGMVVWMTDGIFGLKCKKCSWDITTPEQIECDNPRCKTKNNWTHIQLKYRPILLLTDIINGVNGMLIIGAPITTTDLSWYSLAIEIPARTISHPSKPELEISEEELDIKEKPSYIQVDQLRVYDWRNYTMINLGCLRLEQSIIDQVKSMMKTVFNID